VTIDYCFCARFPSILIFFLRILYILKLNLIKSNQIKLNRLNLDLIRYESNLKS
jgi:hypothetical protein